MEVVREVEVMIKKLWFWLTHRCLMGFVRTAYGDERNLRGSKYDLYRCMDERCDHEEWIAPIEIGGKR